MTWWHRPTPYVVRLANPGKFLYPPPLSDLSAAAFRQELGGNAVGSRRAQLYVHFPFCETICTFCPIHKYQLSSNSPVEEYIKALQAELHSLSRLPLVQDLRFESIYFGGGTPSVTSDKHLAMIMESIYQRLQLNSPQVTFEGNIRTLTRDKIRFVKTLGFNRLSAGVQTLDPELRRALNLVPTIDEIRACIETAREEGFEDFNIDLMFNLPGQTKAIWENDLITAVSMNPSGLDIYETVLANSTALHSQVRRGDLRRERDPRRLAENYLIAEQILESSGYQQKNLFVWNRAGFENKLLDCQSGLRDNELHIVGAGLTAYSMIEGQSYINEAGLGTYIKRVNETGHGIKWTHKCTQHEKMERFMIVSLEDFHFDRHRFKESFGVEMDHAFAKQLRSFRSRDLVEPVESGYRLTPLGRAWAATMAIEFYGETTLRAIMQARLRRSYFGGMTSEEEFELPIFAAYHPRQLLAGWKDFGIVFEYLRYLQDQNRNWVRDLTRYLAASGRRYGLPAVGWLLSTFLRQTFKWILRGARRITTHPRENQGSRSASSVRTAHDSNLVQLEVSGTIGERTLKQSSQ